MRSAPRWPPPRARACNRGDLPPNGLPHHDLPEPREAGPYHPVAVGAASSSARSLATDGGHRSAGTGRVPARPQADAVAEGRGVPARRPRWCDELPAGELERRHAAGTLNELPGIGESTGAVISQALDGEVPDRIAELEATIGDPARRRAPRSAPRSRATATCTPRGATAARRSRRWPAPREALGHEYMVLTDHSPRLTVAHGLNRRAARASSSTRSPRSTRSSRRSASSPASRSTSSRTARSTRTTTCSAELDVVVASVHSKLRDGAQGDDRADGAGGRQPARRHPRPLHRPQAARVRRRPAGRPAAGRRSTPRSCSPPAPSSTPRSRSTAGPSARTRPTSCSTLALEWGCQFSIDTDAHAPGQLEWQNYGCDKAAAPRDRRRATS